MQFLSLNIPYYLLSVLVDDHREDKLPLIHNVQASKVVIDNDSVLAIDHRGKWEVAIIVEHRKLKTYEKMCGPDKSMQPISPFKL